MSNWFLCPIPHNGILFALSFKAMIFYKNSSLVFKSRFKTSNWIFFHISHNGILFAFIQSYQSLMRIQDFFQIQMWNWIFYRISHNGILFALSFKAMIFLLEFKSCFQILDAKSNLFSYISQWNLVCSFIQSYEFLIRIQDSFSNLDSRRQIESFVTYR